MIDKTLANIKTAYICFWIVGIVLLLIAVLGSPLDGAFADQFMTKYLLETITILLAAAGIPVALKLFAWVLTNKIDQEELVQALKLYRKWSFVRLLLLALPLVVGIFTYIVCLSTTGLLCAAIALTASLLCVPSENRLKADLHLED